MSQLGINSLVRLAIGGALVGLHFSVPVSRVRSTQHSMGLGAHLCGHRLCFYWYHRAQHRVRFVVRPRGAPLERTYEPGHCAAAVSDGAFYRALFYWPLPLLGFHPLMVASAGAVATIYAFFTHTEVVKKLWAPLEWWLVTPSHHRAHHGSNPEYVDRNYGNVFIVWDRLFGTFEPEVAPVRYGLLTNIHTYNPLRIAFAEWVRLFQDSFRAGSFRQLGQLWFRPPRSQPVLAEPN